MMHGQKSIKLWYVEVSGAQFEYSLNFSQEVYVEQQPLSLSWFRNKTKVPSINFINIFTILL